MGPLRTPRLSVHIVVLSLLAAIPQAGVAAADADPSEQVNELFRSSGLERQLDSLGPQVIAGISNQASRLPPRTATAMTTAAGEAFSTPALKRSALARLGSQFEPALAEPALAWLRSPIGKKITELEETASTLEGLRGLQAYARSLTADSLSRTRIEMTGRLDRLTGASALAEEIAVESAVAVGVAMDSRNDRPKGAAAVRRGVKFQVGRHRAAIGQRVLVTLLYTYRDLPESEIGAYITFLASAPGRWYNRATSQAMMGAIADSISRMGASLRVELESTR